jgi:type I restriction enzyme M protein
VFEQAFKNIDDILWKEAGCTTELDYTEQTSWPLFLKYLDNLEHDKSTEASLHGKKYSHILDEPYRWERWAAPKNGNGKIDHNKALTGDDLRDFVNTKLFPYLHGFKQKATGPNTIEYKIGEIFGEIKNKIQSGYNCARSSTRSTGCASAPRRKSTNSPTSTKPRSATWATPGATAASTTRPGRSSAP